MGYKSISCYIIGDDNLVIQCAEILLAKKHRILGIISSISVIQLWASQHHIPHFTSLSIFKKNKTKERCDYLMSIVNYTILPDWLLSLPKHFAVNYHDSLLPQYAGIHATSWALMNQEKIHGITWHVVDEKLDSGDILKQAITTINQDETALSLNLKCYHLAITTFAELIDELSDDTYLRTPQNLNQRSYFGRYKKPPANGWINWKQSASGIDQICRALQFGHSINRLSTPKFVLRNDVFIIDKHHVTQHLSKSESGTILNINSEALEIATQTYNIVLSKFRTSNNDTYTVLELCNKYLLKVGDKLEGIGDEKYLYLEQIGTKAAVNEDFWVQQLERSNPIQIPFLKSHLIKDQSSKYHLFCRIKVNKLVMQQIIRHDSTINKEGLFLTLLLIYLYRLCNQENFTIGYNIHTLAKEDLLSSNQVPLNVNFSNRQNFESCLKQVQKQLNTIINKESYLKDIVCRYPSLTRKPRVLPLSITIVDNIANFSFTQFNELIVVIEVSTGLFHLFVNELVQVDFNLTTVLCNIPGHMKKLVSELGTSQGRRCSISKLNILTKKECLKILSKWTKTDAPFYQDKTVHQLFEEQVTKTPNNTAITFQNASLTYSELNQKSNQLARYLNKKGLKRESIVAICLNRGLDMVISLLGVLKAGGAYVPIDPEYPGERIKFIVNDSQTKLIISHSAHKISALFNSKINLILDQEWPIINNELDNNLDNKTQPDDLIYVIYTSGSTGKPKGVLIENKGVVNCLLSIANKIKISSKDKFLAVTPLSFDVAALDYYLPLSFGASTTIVSEEDRKNGENLINLLHQKKITAMQATPSTWKMLVIGYWKGFKNFKILSAGEALSKNLSSDLQQRGLLFNIYGPTETTIYATLNQIKKNSAVAIGKPLANTKAFVLNNEKIPQPIGVVGELYISGIGLARGYLGDRKKTRESFIEDVIIGDYKTRVYKTGDLVRWLPDGNLEYINRIDNQIKLRGYRIESGEIEHLLLEYSGISYAVVLPYEQKGHKQLVAYIKKDDSLPELNEERLKEYLSSRLPDYMIPTLYIEVAEIPLSASGKIRRSALLQIYPPINSQKNNHIIFPSTPIEAILCDIWESYFGIKPISTKDNFFHLGGDSILAMQIVSKARQCNIRLSVKQIFIYPTIKELALVIDEDNEILEIPQIDKELKFALAPIQSWFFSQEFLQKEQWGQLCWIDVMQEIDSNRLKQCLQQLVVEHKALRISFHLDNGVWKQYYGSSLSISFRQTNVSSSLNQDELQQYVKQQGLKIQEQFNLEQGPLLGAELITLNKIPKILVIVAHHLVVDGFSWRILCQDLYMLYKKMTNKHLMSLPHRTSSYRDWIRELFLYTKSMLTKDEKLFWIQQKTAKPLPKDFVAVQNIEKDSGNYIAQFTIEETQLLLQLPIKNSSIKTKDVLLATLVYVFEDWTGYNNISIDIESYGRDELNKNIDISHTVGWFTSIYPLYLEWTSSASLELLIEEIKLQTSLIPNNGIGYGALRYFDLNKDIKNALASKPKSEIVFNYWGQFTAHFGNDLFHLNTIQLQSAKENQRPYVLDISCWISNKQFYISFNYSKQHYKVSTIETLVNNYVSVLKAFLQNRNVECRIKSTTKIPISQFEKEIEGTFPLTSLQKGLLFHTIQAPTSGNYMMQSVWKSAKNFNLCLDALHSAFNVLVFRHQVLRTYFIWENVKEPYQVIKTTAEFNWNVYDWEENISHELERLNIFLEADLQAGVDLGKASLLRITVIRLPDHYYLIVTVPHILLDGWSLAILFKELNTLYMEIINNNLPVLSSTPPYTSFIKWQYKQDLTVAQEFWRKYLSGFLAPSNLSIKHEGAASNNTLVDINEFTLSQEVTEKIKYFCQQNKITVNTFFQGVWGLVLHYYSQSYDVIYGVTLTERNSDIEDAEEIVGLLINTLPFRIQINKDISPQEYFNEIQKNFIQIASYHYTPLTDIQECSEVTNSAQLFDTILVFENYPNLQHHDHLFKFNEIKIIDPTHYSLVCTIIPIQNIKIKLAYDKYKIQTESINWLQGHIQTLITSLIDCPQQSISFFNVLTKEEKQQILIDWNATKTDYPSNKTVHQLFEEQVERTPDKIALLFEAQKLSYKELNNLANQMANYLLSRSIKPKDFIVICVDRSLEMVVAILGTLKIGGVYIPIDPSYPANRMNDIFQDANPAAIIAKKSLSQKNKLNIPNNRIIFFEVVADLTSFSKEKLRIKIEATDLAYIIYTSGSTGKPKGVLIQHRSLVNFLFAMRHYLNPSHEDNVLALTSISFDISGLELYLPLILGAKCIIAKEGIAADGHILKKVILENNITILQATPMTWKILLESGWENKSVKQILCGGEALPCTLAEQLLQKETKVWNLYGPTETTIWSTVYPITNVQKNKAIVPIGKPIINTQLYVLDSNFQPVPVGIIGELYIGGEGLARGYLNNPMMTKKKFVPNPFSENLNDYLYRTGDIVRWLPDGNLEYLQRLDDQVKVNGFRIELLEIQAQLQEHPAIKQVVVIIQGESLGKKYISAYIIPYERNAINQKILRSFMQQKLPAYMVPTYFIFVSHFPLTSNGKIDKKALAAISSYHSIKKEKFPSFTKKEKILVAIWEEVLGIQKIRIHDNFFELGGHSLSALQMLTKVNQHFHIDLPLRVLFENPSIKELEEMIRLYQSEKRALLAVTSRGKTQIDGNCLVTLQPNGNGTPFFLIHPVGGTVFWYVSLVKYLQNERPIYGIQDLGVETGDIPFKSIPEMASFYIEVIQKVQPHGPYYLGGASAGANISIEIAYQLNKMNESVKFIGLLDGWAHYPQSLQDRELFEAIMRKQYNAMHNMFMAKGIDGESLLKLQWTRSRINNEYIPTKLSNKLTLFKAKEIMPIFKPIEHHLNHWEHFSSLPIEVYQVPGNHESMFQEPNVAILGTKLKECLNQADKNH